MIFFEPTECLSSACTVRFTAKNAEMNLGTCDLLLHDGFADLVSVSMFCSDLSVAEGLMRAALNYAANRGCYMACFSAENAADYRALLPFEEKEGVWRGDIPSLLSGSCGKN